MAANTASVSCLDGCLSSVQLSSMQCCGASCLRGGSTQAPVRKLKWFEVVPCKLEAASWNVRMKTTRQLIPWLWIVWTYFWMNNWSLLKWSQKKIHILSQQRRLTQLAFLLHVLPPAAMASTPWEACEASARNASSKMPNRASSVPGMTFTRPWKKSTSNLLLKSRRSRSIKRLNGQKL